MGFLGFEAALRAKFLSNKPLADEEAREAMCDCRVIGEAGNSEGTGVLFGSAMVWRSRWRYPEPVIALADFSAGLIDNVGHTTGPNTTEPACRTQLSGCWLIYSPRKSQENNSRLGCVHLALSSV